MQPNVKAYWQNYINGKWVDASDGGRLTVMNPATAQPLAEVAKATAKDVDAAVAAARACHESRALSGMRPRIRGQMVVDMGRKLRERKEEIAQLLSIDAGKRISEARAEIEGSARYFEFYGGLAPSVEGKYVPLGDGYTDFVVPVPFGVTAHIIPWNYPNNMVARSLAPALATGNTAVIKSAEIDPLSAYVFAELAEEVGFPAGAVNIVCGTGAEAGAALAAHQDIDLIVFTGSVRTGQAILRSASTRIVPCVLELGGKSAGIIFPDADVDNVVSNIIAGLYENAGQVCDSMSRIVIHEDIHDAVMDALSARIKKFSVGPGLEDHDITPLVSAAQLERVSEYAQIGAKEGARVVVGGGKHHGLPGYYHQATVFTDVTPDMRINREEIFGPILTSLKFRTGEEAVAIANGTDYGLAAGIFTADLDRALWCAERLEAGQVHVNEWGVGGPETPFGGFKTSGIGREKGLESLKSYVQSKNVGFRRLAKTI